MTDFKSPLRWESITGTSGQVVTHGGRLLAIYDWGSGRMQPFFHPVYSLRGRQPLTCFAPFDHPWHKGLWWSWKYINGFNFWEHSGEDASTGASRVVDHSAGTTPSGGVLIQQVLSLCPLQGEALLRETRRLHLHPDSPGWAETWAMDWELSWTALQACELSTTPYPEVSYGGYGGLNLRANRTMGWHELLANADGGVGLADCHAAPARWCAYGGALDGDESASFDRPALAGACMLDHPLNPGHPLAVYAGSTGPVNRDFGFLSYAPLLSGPLVLAAGATWRLRFRIVFFDGPFEAYRAENAWREWCG